MSCPHAPVGITLDPLRQRVTVRCTVEGCPAVAQFTLAEWDVACGDLLRPAILAKFAAAEPCPHGRGPTVRCRRCERGEP